MKKNSKENKKSKNKDNVNKIKRDRLRGKLTEKNKTKSIELNVGLLFLKIIIIALLALLITTLTAKTVMTRIEGKVSDNLSGDTTEDVWQIIPASDEEETEGNTEELEEEVVATSTIDENGVTTISTEEDDDYMVVVTEITKEYISVEYDFASTSYTSRCLLGCG